MMQSMKLQRVGLDLETEQQEQKIQKLNVSYLQCRKYLEESQFSLYMVQNKC